MSPKVSVLIAVHNGERYLQAAIESILGQDFADFECIIVDDGSIDDTPRMLAGYSDSRVRVLYNAENIGLTKSLNRGLNAAKGEYIARQDADDLSLPNRLREQVTYLDTHPEAMLVTGNLEIIDADGKSLGVQKRAAPPDIVKFRMLFYNHVGGHSQVMFRREAALDVGGYDESRRYSQDYDLWLRLLNRGEIAILPRVWLQWRQHEGGISSEKFAEQEQISLALSQEALKRVTGTDFSLETVARLRQFWLEPFPASKYAPTISAEMYRLLRAFVAANPTANEATLRQDIAAQFMGWTRSISVRKNPRGKIRVFWIALRWMLRHA